MSQTNVVKVAPASDEGPRSYKELSPRNPESQPKSNGQLLQTTLLLFIAILLVFVLVGISAVGMEMYNQSNSQEAQDMISLARDIKTVMPSLKAVATDDMASVLKVVMPKMKKMATNPLSAMFEGMFEANTNMTRWRAVAFQAVGILDKLSQMDFSVPANPDLKWDAIQYCDGTVENGGFEGDKLPLYDTHIAKNCKDFNHDDSSVFGKGSGSCEFCARYCVSRKCGSWHRYYGYCNWYHYTRYCCERYNSTNTTQRGECSGSDGSFRWIKNVKPSSTSAIITKQTSEDLQGQFVHIKKVLLDFVGDTKAYKIPLEEPLAALDFPFFYSTLMSEVQPSLLKTVIDAVEFLDDHSLMRFVCDPRASKSSLSSCTWYNQGYKGIVDRDIEMALYVVRILAKNALTAWEKRTR